MKRKKTVSKRGAPEPPYRLPTPSLTPSANMGKRYALQIRGRNWEPWQVCREFDTLREAKAAYDALPYKHGYRVAEASVQVRYKAVQL